MKKIGFVIVNYNDYKTTKRLLDEIKRFKTLEKIVVVDNNSTDNSYQDLKKEEQKNVVIIKNEQNNGYASGMNKEAK